jgi:hypothetical protein
MKLLVLGIVGVVILTGCSVDEKPPISITINQAPKPRLVEKCRLETPEGGLFDDEGFLLPFDRICEMVPAG